MASHRELTGGRLLHSAYQERKNKSIWHEKTCQRIDFRQKVFDEAIQLMDDVICPDYTAKLGAACVAACAPDL